MENGMTSVSKHWERKCQLQYVFPILFALIRVLGSALKVQTRCYVPHKEIFIDIELVLLGESQGWCFK